MLHATWNRFRHSTGRLIMTAIAVALATAFLTGSLVLADSTRWAFKQSYAQAYAGIDLLVRGPGATDGGALRPPTATVPADLVDEIRNVPGVAAARGRVRELALLLSPSTGAGGRPAIAMSDPGEGSVQVRAGHMPAAAREVAVDAATAGDLGLSVGDRVPVLLPAGPDTVRISGIVGFGRLDGLAGGARLVLTQDAAENLAAGDGYAEVAIDVESDEEPAEVAGRITALLDPGVAVVTGDEAADEDATAAAAQAAILSRVLLGVSIVALVVGAFIIANTFRILVTQRTRELALLRAVGASRTQVAASVLLEAGASGLLGALPGVAAGVGLGALLVAVSDSLLPGMPPTAASITPLAVLAGPAVALGTSVVSARSAVRRALGIPPVAAMRTAATPEARPGRVRAALGGSLVLAGVGMVSVGAGSAALLVAGGAILTILGAGLVFPFVTGPVLRGLGRPVARTGITGHLAREQALSAPSRVGSTAMALAVPLALVAFLLTFGASLAAASPSQVAARQHAEFTVRSAAPWGLDRHLERVAGKLESLPEVATSAVVAYVDVRVDVPGEAPLTGAAYAMDPAEIDRLLHVEIVEGDLASVAPGGLAVRSRVADANGWDVGDRVLVTLPDGTATDIELGATFDGSIQTDWIVSPSVVSGHLGNAGRQVFARLAAGVTTDAARPTIERVLADYPATELLDRQQQQSEIVDSEESTLGILTALLSLSVLIGALGIFNTLTLAITERTDEFGLLRAVGATRAQIRAMVRWEATLVALLGTGLGTALGIGLAWFATLAFTQFPMPFAVPGLRVGTAIAVTALLGILAAVAPSFRAGRTDARATARMP